MTRPSSVVLGKDRDVIPVLINTHAVDSPRIIDVTYNRLHGAADEVRSTVTDLLLGVTLVGSDQEVAA